MSWYCSHYLSYSILYTRGPNETPQANNFSVINSDNFDLEKMDAKVRQPTVSHHLKILEEAGLVLKRQDGKHRFYTLNQEQLTVCCGVLVRSFAPDYTANLVTVDKIPVVE